MKHRAESIIFNLSWKAKFSSCQLQHIHIPAGRASSLSSSGKWRTLGAKAVKPFSEIPTSKKSLGGAPAWQAASSLTKHLGPEGAGTAILGFSAS